MFFDGSTHYTVADTWRFWITHLWVEGFFELSVTVIVAIIFYQLGLVERATALRVIYLDVVLIFGSGLIGTGPGRLPAVSIIAEGGVNPLAVRGGTTEDVGKDVLELAELLVTAEASAHRDIKAGQRV